LRYWLQAAGKAPSDTNMSGRLWAALSHPIKLPVNVVYYGWSMLLYLGWFLLPLLLPGTWRRGEFAKFTSRFTWAHVAIGSFLAVAVVRFLLAPSLMPVHNNILSPQGIGPATLRDVFNLKLAHQQAIPTWFWLAITLISGLGAMVLILKSIAVIRENLPKLKLAAAPPHTLIAFFFLTSTAAYLTPFLLCGFFDRYLVPVTAFLMVFLVVGLPDHNLTKGRVSAAFTLIALTGCFGVVTTRDYLQWNRVRWEAAHTWQTETGLTPEQLDGGFEFNSWHAFSQTNQPTRWGNRPEYRQWADTVPYVMTFGEIDGFEVSRSYPYQNWLPPHEGRILILKRKGEN